jgi:hypothetical protein
MTQEETLIAEDLVEDFKIESYKDLMGLTKHFLHDGEYKVIVEYTIYVTQIPLEISGTIDKPQNQIEWFADLVSVRTHQHLGWVATYAVHEVE